MFPSMKEGFQRFCVDYQNWNAGTKLDAYSVLCMDVWIAFIGEDAVFRMLEGRSEYWDTETNNADRGKMASTLHHNF